MAIWRTSLVAALLMFCAWSSLFAQTATDPQRAQQEQEAQGVYEQGDHKMTVGEYEGAIADFDNVVKRYPETNVRYQAQFGMANALVSLKKSANAIALLGTIVNEESATWSPKALVKMGEIYASEQKFNEAFRAYKEIIADFPDSPMVDYAYFAIGKQHFNQGHFQQAWEYLDKVGTAYASRVPELQRVFPGEHLYIRLAEPNLMAGPDTKLPVTLVGKSGDKETANLLPEIEGGERFSVAIPTKLGDPIPGDGILQVHGNDTVTLTYKSRYIGGGEVEKTSIMPIASNARIAVRDLEGNEVRGVVVTDTLFLEIYDPDRDVTNNKDSISITLTSKRKDSETVTLTETGTHTGLFTAQVKTAKAVPQPNSGMLETDAQTAENIANQFDDFVTVSYGDEVHLSITETGPRKVTSKILLFTATQGDPIPVKPDVDDPSLAITTLLYKGRSLMQIAVTYRDLGQEPKSILTFREAADQFQQLITKFPNAPEVEDAMYGLFQGYVEQGFYEMAIGMIAQITRRFPQSLRASDALFELAELHVKKEEYERALAIYQSLAQRAKGTKLAEEAQYKIAATYVIMFKPRAGSLSGPQVNRQQIVSALEEFVRAYPTSERAAEAMWQLVSFRFQDDDWPGTVNSARRMYALFPDDVMTGRVLLLMAQAQIKQRDFPGATETLKNIIINFGSEATQAETMLKQIQAKYGATAAN